MIFSCIRIGVKELSLWCRLQNYEIFVILPLCVEVFLTVALSFEESFEAGNLFFGRYGPDDVVRFK
ncbi:hypothetical protein, partial [Paramuribaculum intestinale]|uniref:hypothetical protein n=1 Tax=Paramuribaculum intestinale TaxID=2094151 RepID=UPI0025B6D260